MELPKKINEALVCRKEGNFLKAAEICRDILIQAPNNTPVLSFLGLIYYEIREYKLAVKYLEKAYRNKPGEEIIKTLAFSYYHLGREVEAEKFLKLCIEFDKTPAIYNKLISLMLCDETKYNEAYKYSSELYKKYPFDMENMINLSQICLYTGKFKESISICERAFMLNPEYPRVWIQKGILEEIFNCDDIKARKYFRKALKLGDKENAYYNLCINYSHSDRKKSNYYGKLLIKQGYTRAYNKVMCIICMNYLAMKKVKPGYKYYLRRWDNTPDDGCLYIRVIKNTWKGGIYRNETLFILCDLGFGDKIMYIRYLPFAARMFKNIIVMCDDKLYKLFKRSYEYLENVEFLWENKEPVYDKPCPATYLPAALDMDFDNIPYSFGYLAVDKEKAEEYGKKYFHTSKLKVGLCWEAGSSELRRLYNRSIMFDDLEKLFILNKEVQYYSFQIKSVSADEGSLRSKNIIDLSKIIRDFDDTAALLKNIDVFITVDTSAAHLAGALGVKTFLFLPYFSEWRWFDNTDATEWYNSVKIFKQSKKKSCSIEIERIYNELNKILDKNL